jgi:class I fructose-bisphosphate aldolase
MIQEFEKILDEAHKKLLPVILWAYPRGKGIENKTCEELASYAARFGLEIGADIVKIPYHVSKKDLKWVVKSAGKTKVMIAGGAKENEKDLLRQVKELIEADCIGLAIGRNIWQSRDPLSLTKKIKKIMWRKF